MIDKKLLYRAYCDISLGYTCCSYNGQQVYIRHNSPFNQVDLDSYYEEQLSYAEEFNVPSEKEKLDFLAEEGLWTEKDEKKIEDLRSFINGLKTSASQYFLVSERKRVEGVIKSNEEKLYKLLHERDQLVGLTREAQANKALNSYYIFKSFYKDKELNELMISESDFDEIDDSELVRLVTLYNQSCSHLSTMGIKSLAIAAFFQNYFNLCNDNFSDFYGRPISQLTYNQSELLNYGSYYKQIFQDFPNMPNDVKDDPEKISAYTNSAKSAKSMLTDSKSGNMGVVGATTEDLKALGIDLSEDLASSKLAESGKSHLTMAELIKLQG